MTPQEWNQAPWWETALLIEGLKEDGTLSNGDEGPGMPSPPAGSKQPQVVSVDMSGSAPIPSGFQTRRVG